jgi:purine-binding chemotaxis protein CheW
MLDEQQFVAFRLGSEEYGISILQVQEIKRMTDITRVPYTPPYVKGVINLRGSVLPVIDLKIRLNLPSQECNENTRIIIVKLEEYSVGMIVDEVSEVLWLPADQIEPSPSFVGTVEAEYIRGVGKLEDRLLILLNMENVSAIETTVPRAV